MSPAIKAYQLVLLALVIWREARGAGFKAMIAVGYSIMNRVKKPSWWGNSLVSVITKKWQYSSMAAPNDPQLILYPQENDGTFAQCLEIAQWIINGNVDNPVVGADSYYDDSISAPKWATKDCFVAKIANLNFYNVDKDVEV
jgi:N-acetylmuramoyl-L-alanine amidase